MDPHVEFPKNVTYATGDLTVSTCMLGTATGIVIEDRLFSTVESDALAFLANGEKTDALDSFLADLRAANPQLDQLTDAEILQGLMSAE